MSFSKPLVDPASRPRIKHRLIVSLEGGIGCGKSTILEDAIKFYPELAHYVDEPMRDMTDMEVAQRETPSIIPYNLRPWDRADSPLATDDSDSSEGSEVSTPRSAKAPRPRINPLDIFYSNPPKYAEVFQTFVVSRRLRKLNQIMHDSKGDTKPIVSVRVPLAGDWTFAVANDMDDFNFTVYRDVIGTMVELSEYDLGRVDAVIYVRVSAKTAFERVHKRERPEEAHMLFAYMERLVALHEKLYGEGGVFEQEGKIVIRLDGEEDISGFTDEQRANRCKIIPELLARLGQVESTQ